MPRAGDPPPADLDRLAQQAQDREAARAAEAALARPLAGIEASEAQDAALVAYRAAIRRHGETLHRIGGPVLVSAIYGGLCAVDPIRARPRFDLLGTTWGDLLRPEGKP